MWKYARFLISSPDSIGSPARSQKTWCGFGCISRLDPHFNSCKLRSTYRRPRARRPKHRHGLHKTAPGVASWSTPLACSGCAGRSSPRPGLRLRMSLRCMRPRQCAWILAAARLAMNRSRRGPAAKQKELRVKINETSYSTCLEMELVAESQDAVFKRVPGALCRHYAVERPQATADAQASTETLHQLGRRRTGALAAGRATAAPHALNPKCCLLLLVKQVFT